MSRNVALEGNVILMNWIYACASSYFANTILMSEFYFTWKVQSNPSAQLRQQNK